MKTKHLFFISCCSILAITLLAACNSNENQLRKIAYGYLDAMGNYRIADAYPYATIETQKTTLRYIEQNVMPLVDSASVMQETPAVITITSVKITSDTTATVMFHKSTPVSERNNILNMVKRDGKWLADVVMDGNQSQPLSKIKSKTQTIDTTNLKNKTFKVVRDTPPPPKKHK